MSEEPPTASEIARRAWLDDSVPPVPVQLGSWRFELRADEIADISWRGVRLLRNIRAVARDRDWNTVPTRVTSLSREGHEALTLGLSMSGFGAQLEGRLRIAGGTGTLTVDLDLELAEEFARNRIGLVVLHPADAAGAPLVVTHPDGSSTRTVFPTRISPHQPALQISRLEWSTSGVDLAVEFRGEVFEMEDQRNWTDASYKTYSTPLALPFPVSLPGGAVVRHGITVSAAGSPHLPEPGTEEAAVHLREARRPFPSIQSAASTAPRTPTPAMGRPTLVELDLDQPSWLAALERARWEADGAGLDVRLIASRPDSVHAALGNLAADEVVRLGVFDATTHLTTAALWDALRSAASAAGFTAQLVGGTRAHFTELNRGHEQLPRDLDALTFSSTPQMHAREWEQIVESIPIQALTLRDARLLAGDRPVHVGPITLAARFNAVATQAIDPVDDLSHGYGAELVPGATDARQAAPALASWTVASAAALAGEGASSLTYFETTGSRGIFAHDGSPLPAAAALADLAALTGGSLLVPKGWLPAGLWAVGAAREGSATVLVANLTSSERPSVVVRFAARHVTTDLPAWSYRRVVL